MHFSILELWAVMGPVAKAVVGLLVLMSLLSLATAAEKWFVLRRAAAESTRFLDAWRRRVSSNGVTAAAADAADFPHSPVAHVIAAGTDVLRAGLPAEVQREAYDRTVRRAVLAAGSAMRRGLSIIATVGSTAPFVGLVGTVVGIVNAFQQLASAGQGGVGQVSAGIAEALVTTAIGIGVAIPAVWLFNHLTQWISRLLVEMECAAEELAVAALGESARPLTQASASAGASTRVRVARE
jgi:biopolymer transport protein ExbB